MLLHNSINSICHNVNKTFIVMREQWDFIKIWPKSYMRYYGNKTIFIVNSFTVVVTLLCHDPNPRLYCMCTSEISTPENSREKLHEDAAIQFKFVHGCTCKTQATRLLVNRSNVFYKLKALAHYN